MKILFLTCLPMAILAQPATTSNNNSIADNLMFGISLPNFIKHRNAKIPANFDWSSDGCTDSLDNPFGFPFTPACNRHDFGYQNFRIEKRFTKANKARIDQNFKKEYVSRLI